MKTTKHTSVVLIAIAMMFFIGAGNVNAEMEEIPLLRANVTVDDELVRLGDIFLHAGDVSDTAVFQAPAPGTTGMVSASRLERIAHNHGLTWDNPEQIRRISILRSGVEISLDDISSLITDTIEMEIENLGSDSSFAVEFRNNADAIFVAASEEPTFEISRLRFNRSTGQFTATILAPADRAAGRQFSFSGRATEVRPVAVLLYPVPRGQVIGAGDVEERLVPVNSIASDAVYEMSDLIGMAARRQLRADQPIRSNDLEEPRIVQRNGVVMVTYQAPGLMVSVRARALDDGAMGDTIRILNLHSNRVIEGTVVGANAVSASVTSTNVVAAAN